MSDLTAANLAELTALAQAATPGPWEVHHVDDAYAMSATYVGTGGDADLVEGQAAYAEVVAITLLQAPLLACHASRRWDEDPAFIAASRAAVPALVATVHELARAIVGAFDTRPGVGPYGEFPGDCPCCRAHGGETHEPGCAVPRARALLGEDGA